MNTDVTTLLSRQEELYSDRTIWESSWDDILYFCLPNREPVLYYDEPGTIRNLDVYDSTASEGTKTLAASLNSMLTNQAAEWFQLETDNEELNEEGEVKEWLNEATKVISKALENSNFYTEVHEMYLDLASIGTGVLYIDSDSEAGGGVNFQCRHIKEIFIAENNSGRVDTLFRKFEITVKNAVAKWGLDKLSDKAAAKYEDHPDDKMEILHCVMPREEYDSEKKDPENMKYASCWIELEGKHKIDEGGYEVFPYLVPRWLKSSGEKYGRSPALSILPDIKTLNQMWATMIKQGQKRVDPPMKASPDLEEVDLTPGAVNFIDPSQEGVLEPLDIGGDLGFGVDLIQIKTDRVQDAFMVNKLQRVDQTKMTAEEVRARTQENMKILGPTFGRLQSEFLELLIERVINILQYIMDDEGNPKLPIPPNNVQGKTLQLKFVSPLAKGQKMGEVQNIMATINIALSWAEANPSILDNIDFDRAITEIADLQGTMAGIIKDKKVVAQMRAQRQQAMMAQQQAQQQEQRASMVKDAGSAAKDVATAENTLREAA